MGKDKLHDVICSYCFLAMQSGRQLVVKVNSTYVDQTGTLSRKWFRTSNLVVFFINHFIPATVIQDGQKMFLHTILSPP